MVLSGLASISKSPFPEATRLLRCPILRLRFRGFIGSRLGGKACTLVGHMRQCGLSLSGSST